MKHKVAVQLYTLRDDCEKDLEGVLTYVAGLGYKGVEFAGFYDWPARKVKSVLQELGLRPVVSHVMLDVLQNRLPETISFHREIGCDYLVCPYMDPGVFTDRARIESFASQLAEAAAELARHDIRLGYHHHDFEFLSDIGGERAIDVLYGAAAPLVRAQLDVFWIRKSGADELAYIRQYAGKVPVLHLKDMEAGVEGTFAEVGAGTLDFKAILRAGDAAGVQWYTVEQDICLRHKPMESVKISLDYLRRLDDEGGDLGDGNKGGKGS